MSISVELGGGGVISVSGNHATVFVTGENGRCSDVDVVMRAVMGKCGS